MQSTDPTTGITYPSACHRWARADFELPFIEAGRRVFAAAIDSAEGTELAQALAELRSEWEYLNRSHDARGAARHYLGVQVIEYEQQATAARMDELTAAEEGDPANARAAAAAGRIAVAKADAYRDAARVLDID